MTKPICPLCGNNENVKIWDVPLGHGKATQYACVYEDCWITFYASEKYPHIADLVEQPRTEVKA